MLAFQLGIAKISYQYGAATHLICFFLCLLHIKINPSSALLSSVFSYI